MRLLPVCFLLFAVLQSQAQQGSPRQADGAGLTRASFTANGLANEKLLTDLYLGDFRDIDLERSDVLFLGLYSEYLRSFGRRCADYLPKNKVELMETYCAQQQYNIDRYGNKVPASSCLVYSTRGTGIMPIPLCMPPRNSSIPQWERTRFGRYSAPCPERIHWVRR